MTWTYDPRIDSNLNRLRRQVGDTNENDKLLEDEEYSPLLSQYDVTTDEILLAGADAAGLIRAELARNVDRNNLGMSASRSQVQQHYKDLADEWRAEYVARNGSRAVLSESDYTGTSADEIRSLRQDDDYLQPAFQYDQWDNDC